MPVYHSKDLRQILAGMEKGHYAPAYLLWGERYLYQAAFEQLICALLPEGRHSTNLYVTDADNEDVHRLVETLNTFPFFGGRQVVVAKDTRFLSSRATSGSVLKKSREQFSQGKVRAAAKTLVWAMSLSGLALEDVRDGGWRHMSDEQWEEVFGGPKADEDMAWLDEVIAFAVQSDMDTLESAGQSSRVLEEALRKGIPSSNHLVLLTETVDKRLSLYRAIEEIGIVIAFDVEKGAGAAAKRVQDKVLHDLVRDALAPHGKSIEPRAVSSLMGRIGFNPASVASAVEKLVNYSGERRTITCQDVEAVVKQEKEEPIYELTGAFAERDIEKALLSLNRLLEQGYAGLQILAGITKQIRRLLLARSTLDTQPGWFEEGEIPRGLEKTSPYPLFLLFKHARAFETDHLITCMSEALKVDIALKSGAPEPRFLLEDLILKCLVEKAAAGNPPSLYHSLPQA